IIRLNEPRTTTFPATRNQTRDPRPTMSPPACDCPPPPLIPIPATGAYSPAHIPALGEPLTIGTEEFQRPKPTGAIGDRAGLPMDSFAVDRMAETLATNARPRYPEMLRASGVEGRALLEFVIDTAGRVDRESIREIQATNALFAQAARDVLRDWRFHPAESGGHTVRVRMQQPFDFRLTR
ncbi:MAG: energy transducer TonB, partial [Gemmatimonadaceae bacterium]